MSAVPLTLGWIAGAVGGSFRGRGETPVHGVVTDSRAMTAGDVFVALRGPRFDGHAFAAEALARGAAGVVVEREWAEAHSHAGDGVIGVSDTLEALQETAHAVRVASAAKVVAITGSAGKTTTKESIAALLATRFRVVKNQGNLNNHIGLPLSLMQLTSGPDVAVMELGMNHAGEIRALVRIASPTSACGPTWATPIWASSRRWTRLPTPRPRCWRMHARATCSCARPTTLA